MYKFIEYKKSIEDFVGCTQEKLLMTTMEGFGGIRFHNFLKAHYNRFGKCVQFMFYFGLYIIT
jgi:hypothetical protein